MMIIGELVTIADKLAALQPFKRKLFKQSDPAAEKLIITLEEIYKIYLSLEAEITSHLSVWLDNENKELHRARAVLVGLEGEEIEARMQRSR